VSAWDAARFGWLLTCTVAASVTDLRERRIPNAVVAACALATPVWVAAEVLSWQQAVLGGGLLGGVFLLPALLGKAGMGAATLAAALGMGIGWRAVGPLLVGTAVAVLIGAVVRRFATSGYPCPCSEDWPLAPAFAVGLLTALLARL
jgi:Flp pilus assembly protein protease CpaA